ncbi:lysozyme inhibitor LprI family protein [Paraburkholderia caballeronis]|uniref:lysozyme inhibitor LprI family protein n=1 Tax=Paraburkholderia caballeronis TaxID=416943 RepID=UPI001064FBE3|nr:DUF6426 family protein [Paraburkholderia caballeronis]
MVDNGTYGYEPALSEDDIKKGTATKPLIMMRYAGNKNGTFVILILGQDANNSSVVTRVSCQVPCQFAKSETIVGDEVAKTETLRVTPDSIVGGMLQDAVSGQLIVYGQNTGVAPVAAPPQPQPAAQQQAQEVPQAPVAAPQVSLQGATPAAQQPAAPAAPPQSESVASSTAEAGAHTYETSFDCSKARTLNEYLICHDSDLAASDKELGALYQQAKEAATDKQAFADRTRKQWNFREKNCHDKACLVSWYSYQKDVLTKIAQTGDASAQQ